MKKKCKKCHRGKLVLYRKQTGLGVVIKKYICSHCEKITSIRMTEAEEKKEDGQIPISGGDEAPVQIEIKKY